MKRQLANRLGSEIGALFFGILLAFAALTSQAQAQTIAQMQASDGVHPEKGKKESCAKLQLTPDPVNFGDVEVGNTASRTVTVTNPQTNPTVDVGAGTKKPFSAESRTCSALPPGGTCEIDVSFAPEKKGKLTARSKCHTSDAQIRIMGSRAKMRWMGQAL